MSEYTKLMLKYSEGELEIKEAFQIEKKILENEDLKKEYLLNQRIDDYMRLQQMVHEIHNDPELAEVESTTKKEINNYILNESEKDPGVALFINTAIKKNKELEILIDEAEREMHLSGIDRQAYEWVQKWEIERSQSNQQDIYTSELIDFIRSGMKEGSNTETRLMNNNNWNRNKLLIYLSSAAAILILAFGIWGIFNSKTSPNELFVEYYQTYRVVDIQTRSTEQQFNIKYEEAIKLYQKGNFSKASLLFKELLHVDSNLVKIRFLYGISQLEEQQYEIALLNFKEIIKNNGEYVIEAKWYMAMIYLKKEDIKSAGVLLKELAETPGYYMDKSKEILEKL